MVDFKYRPDVERWLADKPREYNVTIAARAALRAIPRLAPANVSVGHLRQIRRTSGELILATFRGMAAAWAVNLVGASDRDSLREACTDAAYVCELAYSRASYENPAAVLVIRAAARAAAAAAAAMRSADPAFIADPAADAVASSIAADAGPVFAAADSRSISPTADSASVYAANYDAGALDRAMRDGVGTAAELARQALWPRGIPEWVQANWSRLKQDLLHDAAWEVWVEWYEARLVGDSVNKALEIDRARIPELIWRRGEKPVSEYIKSLIEKHRFERPPKPDEAVEPVPSQAPGPHYRADADGRIDRAPSCETDRQGNDRQTIDQLKPLVLQCAAALEARLSKNEFPELLASVQQYRGALAPRDATPVEWGTVWGAGVILQNAADAAEREIKNRTLPELEDPAKTALDSLLRLHGPMILATAEGVRLSEAATGFAMTREQQEALRAAAEEVVERLKADKDIITPRAAETVSVATEAIGQGRHPERGSVYGLANLKNVSIVLIGGAALATPTIGALIGGPIGALIGTSISLLGVEAVKKSPAFTALTTQLGARLDAMTDTELRAWLDERARRLAPFRRFVILNQEPLRRIAETTPELKWMLRYIDFIVVDPET